MKTKMMIAGIFLLATGVTFQSCNDSLPTVDENLATEKSYPLPGDSCTYTGVLTDAEIEGLMEMREEEKLAGDVYTTFFEQYGQVVFENISKSEVVHANAVLNLINGYGLEDPAKEAMGEFSNPLFNELFAQLTEQGSVSLVEALKVGAFIEEYDINDLMMLLENTQNADVARVYGNLMQGSESHLRAFAKTLDQLGATYIPSVMNETLYQEILSGTNSGRGKTNQYGKGNGTGTGNSNKGDANQGYGNRKQGKN